MTELGRKRGERTPHLHRAREARIPLRQHGPMHDFGEPRWERGIELRQARDLARQHLPDDGLGIVSVRGSPSRQKLEQDHAEEPPREQGVGGASEHHFRPPPGHPGHGLRLRDLLPLHADVKGSTQRHDGVIVESARPAAVVQVLAIASRHGPRALDEFCL